MLQFLRSRAQRKQMAAVQKLHLTRHECPHRWQGADMLVVLMLMRRVHAVEMGAAQAGTAGRPRRRRAAASEDSQAPLLRLTSS